VVSNCANPNCCRPFLYLREGTLFLFETNYNSRDITLVRKGPRRLESFWLCANCSSSLVVRMIRGKAEIVPRGAENLCQRKVAR